MVLLCFLIRLTFLTQKQLFIQTDRHWPMVIIALNITASDRTQKIHLFLFLHTLHDHRHLYLTAHGKQRLQDTLSLPVVLRIELQEFHVDLHGIHLKTVQGTEG